MKFKTLAIIACVSLFSSAQALALAAENKNTNPASETTKVQLNDSMQSNMAGNKDSAMKNKDGEIIATLIVLDKNEIAAANLAAKKNLSPGLKKYVNTLRKDHAKNLDDTMKLSKKIKESPNQTGEVNALHQQGKQQIAILEPLNNQQFAIIFIRDMVKDHQSALDKIDHNLLQNANNPQLKKHLELTREKIVKHLQEAKQLENQETQNDANQKIAK